MQGGAEMTLLPVARRDRWRPARHERRLRRPRPAMGVEAIITHPLHIFYTELLREYTEEINVTVRLHRRRRNLAWPVHRRAR
jgi:hypothetical protein